MSSPNQPIQNFPPKSLPFLSPDNQQKARDVVDAINRVTPITGSGGIEVVSTPYGTNVHNAITFPPELRVPGVIVNHGPNGEPDWPSGDARYWVQLVYMADVNSPHVFTDKITTANKDIGEGEPVIVCCTNRFEKQVEELNGPVETHLLAVGTEVLCHQELTYYLSYRDEPMTIWQMYVTPMMLLGYHCLQGSGDPTCGVNANTPNFTTISLNNLALYFNLNWFDVYQQLSGDNSCNPILTMVDWTGFTWKQQVYGTSQNKWCGIQQVNMDVGVSGTPYYEPTATSNAPTDGDGKVYLQLPVYHHLAEQFENDPCNCPGDNNQHNTIDIQAYTYISPCDFSTLWKTGSGSIVGYYNVARIGTGLNITNTGTCNASGYVTISWAGFSAEDCSGSLIGTGFTEIQLEAGLTGTASGNILQIAPNISLTSPDSSVTISGPTTSGCQQQWTFEVPQPYSGYSGYSGQNGSGVSGYSGANGTNGTNGTNGASGYSGYSGTNGSGTSGYSGKSGTSGYSGSGISGYSGSQGSQGPTGPQGVSGYSGSGISGYSGFSGKSGWSGYSGSGISGYSGSCSCSSAGSTNGQVQLGDGSGNFIVGSLPLLVDTTTGVVSAGYTTPYNGEFRAYQDSGHVNYVSFKSDSAANGGQGSTGIYRSNAGGSKFFLWYNLSTGDTNLDAVYSGGDSNLSVAGTAYGGVWGVHATGVVGSYKMEHPRTTYSGSIGGSAVWSMPIQGASFKLFIINMQTLHDAGGTITFPTAFTKTPYLSGDASATAVATASTTTFTLAASVAATGTVLVQGY